MYDNAKGKTQIRKKKLIDARWKLFLPSSSIYPHHDNFPQNVINFLNELWSQRVNLWLFEVLILFVKGMMGLHFSCGTYSFLYCFWCMNSVKALCGWCLHAVENREKILFIYNHFPLSTHLLSIAARL